MKKFLPWLITGFVGLIIIVTIRIVLCVTFGMHCTQYLKRAADANNVELAQANIEKAVKFLEQSDLTNGVVSIFLNQPVNDIGFWYSNLKASQIELSKVTDTTTQLERSNILMKLRETLLDNNKEGQTVTCPKGISVYPHNVTFFFMTVVFGVMATYGFVRSYFI